MCEEAAAATSTSASNSRCLPGLPTDRESCWKSWNLDMNKLISDTYRQHRGNWSRILSISCASCSHHLFFYQKDGPGIIKRSYLDRIMGAQPAFDAKKYYFCPTCHVCLGFSEPYAKERNRPALRWAAGAMQYEIVPMSSLVDG
jgi:hypothetical protein